MSISRRHVVTGALLAFVAVTAVTLAVKETGHARAVAAAEAARAPAVVAPAAEVPDPTPSPVVAPAEPSPAPEPTAGPAAKPATRPPVTRPVVPMPAPAATAPPAPVEKPATIYVSYFHTTARCTSCLKIEDLTNATMSTRFAGPIAEKRVVWRSVNLDEPANSHFAKDYSLYTKSVVVSEVREGREVRWKNLDQVWHFLGDSAAFQAYVEREVRAFLEGA